MREDTRYKQEMREALHKALDEAVEELQAWREAHPEASFDEIAAQVTPRRQALMGISLTGLACQHGERRVVGVGWSGRVRLSRLPTGRTGSG